MKSLRVALLATLALSAAPAGAQLADWPVTEGAPGGGRYSPLTDITRENVDAAARRLDLPPRRLLRRRLPARRVNRGTAFESTPIVVDGRLFFTTPCNRVIALDPETGRELWTFDPKLERGRAYANMWINRGVAYWRGADGERRLRARASSSRTLDARLIALDAATGKPVRGLRRERRGRSARGHRAASTTPGSTTSPRPARWSAT